MASYLELNTLSSNADLVNKITAGIAIVAHGILQESPTTPERKEWAISALVNPVTKTPEMMWYILAANASSTTTQILNAADSTIQTKVADAVTKRIGAAS